MNSIAQNSVTPQQQTKNRRMMLLIFGIFLLPVLVAYSAHFFGWYEKLGTNNHGHLINPPAEFTSMALSSADGTEFKLTDHPRTWFVIFVMPETCDKSCENSLYMMRQVGMALGVEQHRVMPMAVHWAPPEPEWQALSAEQFPNLTHFYATAEAINTTLQPAQNTEKSQAITAGQVYIMDPWGFIMLSYPAAKEEQQSIQRGKDLLNDLKRLLKVSRIG